MSRNREIAEAFAAQFDPVPPVVQTRRINNVPHRDAWLAAAYDQRTGCGVTAHAYGGQLHAYVEVLADGDAAVEVGKVMAATMGRLKQDGKNQAAVADSEGRPTGKPGPSAPA